MTTLEKIPRAATYPNVCIYLWVMLTSVLRVLVNNPF